MQSKEAYVVILSGAGDFYWYLLDEAAWNSLDEDTQLQEALDSVTPIATGSEADSLFRKIRDDGYTIVNAADGCFY